MSEPTTVTLDSDPQIQVRTLDASDHWSYWNISQNLTDRWGEINFYDSTNKPLDPMLEQPSLLENLRAQMWDEITFITRKDGQFGILYEVEFCSRESEDDEACKPHAVVVGALIAGMQKLQSQFPGVHFCVPHESQVVNDRPAAWAFVPDGHLDEAQRRVLGMALLDL